MGSCQKIISRTRVRLFGRPDQPRCLGASMHVSSPLRLRLLGPATILAMTAAFLSVVSPPAQAAPHGDDTPVLLTPKGEIADEVAEKDEQGSFDKLRDAYYWSRLLSGDEPLSVDQAATLRSKAAKQAGS